MQVITTLTLASLTALGATALTVDDGGTCSASKTAAWHNDEASDIVSTAVNAGSFNTLVAAVKAAGLVEALQGEGPFTVFAPTDEAFAKLPAGTLESLLEPKNKAKLASILTYHVVPANVMARDVVKVTAADTLNGQRLDVLVSEERGVRIDGANVVKTDIKCSNGTIHVIDTVMLPSDKSIVATADGAGTFKTLLAAAKAAGLAKTLAEGGPFTVLAPTDDAFAKLPAGTVESLLKPENKEKLATILKYHVISGRVFSDGAIKAGHAATLQGGEVRFQADEHGVRVEGANVVAADLDASNGVVHVIDTVLMPR
ncbi:MAG: fasciclin domain-containing protein [Planctomycetota bacterium]